MALARVLAVLEERFGGLHELIRPKPVITDTVLLRQHLEQLFAHEASAIHVKKFYPPNACKTIVDRLCSDPSKILNWKVATGRGLESSDVATVGVQPFNMVAGSKDASAQGAYFNQALACMRELRESEPLPLLGPLDKLRLELDEIWPHGATVTKNKEGRPFVAGLARVMRGPTRWLEGFCHVDDLSPLQQGQGLFSANMYLQLPSTGGGNLLIWDVELRSRLEFYKNASTLAMLTVPDPEGQRRLRARLPKPKTLQPEAGDLIILCAQRPHAVQGFPLGTRVSIQSFLSYKKDSPLSLDN